MLYAAQANALIDTEPAKKGGFRAETNYEPEPAGRYQLKTRHGIRQRPAGSGYLFRFPPPEDHPATPLVQ